MVDTYLRAKERAEQEYQAALKKANQAYLRDLDKELATVLKSGDLDAALWLRQEVERVRLELDPPKKEVVATEGSPEWIQKKAVSGPWYCGRFGPYWFLPDGTAAYGPDKGVIGKWRVDKKSIVFSNSYVNREEAFVYAEGTGFTLNGSRLVTP
jgi:hypothetical protein